MPDRAARRRQIEELFELVVDLPPQRRRGRLEELCPGDGALRAEVETLLEAFDEAPEDLLDGAVLHAPDESPTTPASRDRPLTHFSELPGEAPGDRIGPYRLLEVIGEGGMGTVYLADQEQPIRRRVALKIIKLGMDTRRVIARFEAERQALAMMDTPHIARVLDAGATESGRPYFVMELVNGVAITTYADDHQLGIEDRLRLFMPVCRALEHAHQKGIIHRDVKPSNVLVAFRDGRPTPVVIDFGIAKATGSQLTGQTLWTEDRQLIGTPEYMSPEQADRSGLDIDTRSDIYSLGVLLYELLAGVGPFDRQRFSDAGDSEIQRILREEEAPRPSTRLVDLGEPRLREVARQRRTEARALRSQLSGDLDWILMRCLEKDRTRRYETCTALASDLERCLDHQPVSAGPPSSAYRLRKYVRRHRGWLAAAASFTVLLLAFSLGMLVLARSEKHAKEEALASLAESNLARGQLLGATGAIDNAEELLWSEYFREQSPLTHWALWELYSKQPRLAALAGHADRVLGVAVQPGERLVASAGLDGTVRLWDARTASTVAVLDHEETPTWGVGFNAAGERLVSSDERGVLRVWRVATGELLHRIETGNPCGDVLFLTPAQDLLLAAGFARLEIWDLTSERRLHAFGDTVSPFFRAAVLAPDGRTVATRGPAEEVELYRLDLDAPEVTSRPLATLTGLTRSFRGVSFHPDGETIAAGGADKSLRIWELPSGESKLAMNPSLGTVRDVAYTQAGRFLIVGGWYGIAVFDAADYSRRRTLGELVPLEEMVVTPSELIYAATSFRTGRVERAYEGLVRIWELEPMRCLQKVRAHTGLCYTIGLSDDGQLLATGGADHLVRLWNAETRELLATLTGHEAQVNAVRFSPDGLRLASASIDGVMKVWDAITAKPILTLSGGLELSGTALAFMPDGHRLLAGRLDGTVGVWEIPSGRELPSIRTSDLHVVAIAVSADGKRICTTARDNTLRFWDGTSYAPLGEQQWPASPWFVAFRPDGRELAVGSWDRLIDLIDVESGEKRAVLDGHTGLIRCIAYHPDPDRDLVVSCGDDGEIRLWSSALGECLATLDPEADDVYAVAFVPRGPAAGTLVSAHADGTIGFWDLSYYDRHIAGNLEAQLQRLEPRLRPSDIEQLRSWAREALKRDHPALPTSLPSRPPTTDR